MRFLADENISRQIVTSLRNAGHDVVTVSEASPGAPDDRVLEIALSQSRVLLTEDQDFSEMVVRQKLAIPAVVLLELGQLSAAAEAQIVMACVRDHRDRIAGHLVVVEPTRIRFRPLVRP